MKSILIIKTGTISFKPEVAELGDFEDWIIEGTKADATQFKISSPFLGEELPEADTLSGIIITGSPTMLTENPKWLATTIDWLKKSLSRQIPTLGICFGHQLIANAMNGIIDFHPSGREIGTVDIYLKPNASSNPLFYNVPNIIKAHVIHSQSVIKLAENAEILAENNFEPHHAFTLNNHIWGVQFHPEFNENIMESIINLLYEELTAEGIDIKKVINSITYTPYGSVILENFYNITKNYNQK